MYEVAAIRQLFPFSQKYCSKEKAEKLAATKKDEDSPLCTGQRLNNIPAAHAGHCIYAELCGPGLTENQDSCNHILTLRLYILHTSFLWKCVAIRHNVQVKWSGHWNSSFEILCNDVIYACNTLWQTIRKWFHHRLTCIYWETAGGKGTHREWGGLT